jgi:pimeloyl-ACP methyl ester carboxylesterase
MSGNLADTYAAFYAAHPPRYTLIAGHRWEHIDAGVGDPPLVMLPGGFGVAATSFCYIPTLAAGRRVIALSYPPNIDTIADLCDGMVALFDSLGVARAWVLGGSAGGFAAQALVRRHPSRVAGLILAQSGVPRPSRARICLACAALLRALPMPLIFALLRLSIAADLRGSSGNRRFWRGHFAEVLSAQSRSALVSRFRLAADFDANYRFGVYHKKCGRCFFGEGQALPEPLPSSIGRIAIIESARDGLVGPGERAALRALYPGADVYTLVGGHNDSVERPDEQIALIAHILLNP